MRTGGTTTLKYRSFRDLPILVLKPRTHRQDTCNSLLQVLEFSMRSKSQSKKNGLSSVEENLRLEGQVPGLARTMVRSLSEERSITRPTNEEALQTPAPIPNPRGSRQSYRDQKPLHFYLVSVTEWMEPQF